MITSPHHPQLDALCRELAARADALDASGAWPEEQLRMCGEQGVFRWFVPEAWGGFGWSNADVVRGYLKLSAACLTTTFIITQRTGACRRILAGENESLRRELLPDLTTGASFATVGISHLTTSRRHLARPVMTAREEGDGFVLDGFSPWVTGGAFAKTIVTGATLDDGRQILLALPAEWHGSPNCGCELDSENRATPPGVTVAEPAKLVGLSASHTGAVHCRGVPVDRSRLLAGPVENVMSQGEGARTGGLETSTLAIGLAAAAIAFLAKETEKRADLADPSDSLQREHAQLTADLLEVASGEPVCTFDEIRVRANSLVLRATQAALMAAKGTGYVAGHSVGRWCREALFFLVWSCPQPVMAANLCELAGLNTL
jgi:alkylation response protein AidB-like acyl-CoA dehydrogenase